jgi:hypothetical protein
LRKFLPYVLLFLGVILLGAAGFYGFHTSGGPKVEAPASVAGLALASSQSGQAAIATIQQLHGQDLKLKSGLMVAYGPQSQATLWVAGTASESDAANMIGSMETKIAAGGTPFSPMGVFKFQNRDVYLLEGQGLTHFYVQSGSRVFWLSISSDLAEQAMKELLAFYP